MINSMRKRSLPAASKSAIDSRQYGGFQLSLSGSCFHEGNEVPQQQIPGTMYRHFDSQLLLLKLGSYHLVHRS